uniref:NADH-ubiquinone oxidoreductase chain 4L n=1 Tax=Polyplacotoma mediterranea TaxID=2283839 RepID=A0A481YNC9_9METZ|nr:NADH dehydrogenase subunit 4L [Polyplacotoma mediterranea]QBK82184.1 NADH dehydrogenase subunit 4L [Polyplacotoma mediterranea]
MTTGFLLVSIILFTIGVSGIIINKRNIILILMSIELILLAISFMFITYSVVLDDLSGIIFSLMVLTIAAAESAIGLAVLTAYYRLTGTITIKALNLLRG